MRLALLNEGINSLKEREIDVANNPPLVQTHGNNPVLMICVQDQNSVRIDQSNKQNRQE